MNINKKNFFLIILPAIIFILAVIFSTDIIFTHKVDLSFIYNDGKIGGSRWFSYKYTGEKYFHENLDSLNNKFISKNDALKQLPLISKSRDYSKDDVKLIYNLIDSLFRISDRSASDEKVIEIMKLNIALDEINQ